MRRSTLFALALVAAVLVGAIVTVSCSSKADCHPATLSLQVTTALNANLADTFTVTSDDVGAAFSETFPHTPTADTNSLNSWVEVTWPDGYPADSIVHLHVSALAGGVVLSDNDATIRLAHTCSTGHVLLVGGFTLGDGGD